MRFSPHKHQTSKTARLIVSDFQLFCNAWKCVLQNLASVKSDFFRFFRKFLAVGILSGICQELLI